MSVFTTATTAASPSQGNSQALLKQNVLSHAYDPVDKLRVSQPQALIDTDFEYGVQPTKWESIVLQNNRASCYYTPQSPRTITTVTGNGTTTVVVNMGDTTGFSVGSLIYVQNSLDTNANGWYYVTAVSANVSVTYIARGNVANGNQYNPASTYVFLGFFYSNCGVAVGANAFTTDGTTNVSVSTTYPHGLNAGSLIYIVNTSSTSNSANGAFVVVTTPTANSFTYTAPAAITAAAVTNSSGNTVVYARPAGYVETRAFDGGVAFSVGAAAPNQQLIRQTRRYFRYQSGKGIQFSTGTSLCPPLFVTGISAVGATVTITTRFPHNITAGAVILVSGVNEAGYNGTWTVASAPTLTTLTYTAAIIPTVTPATGFPMRVNPISWFGSSNRIGMFDQQNGLFFEYDGQTLYAVWRNSVNQINGTVQVTKGNGLVTGSGTQFLSQLAVGDFIVIRGQSYRVMTITSDTALYISPEYRGTTISSGGCLVSRTSDTRVPQSQWIDTCDGSNGPNNPSGYKLDLTKMQMFYIDYSWYGGGHARWGLRGPNGAVIYVQQQVNNNARYEAYMRSGNMASHYESNGITPMTFLTKTLSNTETGTLYLADTSLFASSGVVKLQNSGVSGTIEHIAYTGKTATTLTGLTRTQTGGNTVAQTFTYSASAPISIEYMSPDTACALSHWGSSVIMDGQFNDDKSLIFNYGTTTAITTTSTTPVVVLAIRVAPSVDSGRTGAMGDKEIINRMQLQLTELGLVTTGTGYLINLILNGYASGATSGSWISPVQGAQGAFTSSLAQVATNTNAVSVTGGESVAASYCPESTARTTTVLDLSGVRDLGNSILGGGSDTAVPTAQSGFYPDGPDVLYVVATPLTAASSTILARLSWKEAQA